MVQKLGISSHSLTMTKKVNNSFIQVDTRLNYLYRLSQYSNKYGKRLLALSNKSQRRLKAGVKRRICECGQRLDKWTIQEFFVSSKCENCQKERILKRFLKNGTDLRTEIEEGIENGVIREKNRERNRERNPESKEKGSILEKNSQKSEPKKRGPSMAIKKKIKGVQRKQD